MTQRFSLLITYISLAVLIVAPIAAVYFAINIDVFGSLAQQHFGLLIRWESVTSTQWYGLWFLTVIFKSIGLIGLFYLYRAFAKFAKGEFFNLVNSKNLRVFSIFLFIQALANPLLFTLSSILLSWNHPPMQKMVSVSVGSNELSIVVLAMILWVISDLLVKGYELKSENNQFV